MVPGLAQLSGGLIGEWTRWRSSQTLRWIVLLNALITLGLLAFGGALLLDARHDAWRQAEQAADNLTKSIARDIARNIELFDLSLQGVVMALQVPNISGVSPEIRQLAMFGRSASAAYLGSLVVTDADGNAIADSNGLRPGGLRVADREYFLAHTSDADAGLFISRPLISRLRGDPSIAFSRRISAPDGRFAGVVVGVMKLAYFTDMFARFDLGATGSITLFRADGRILARRPFVAAELGADLSSKKTFRRLLEASSGHFVGTAALDRVERLYTYQRIGDLPLIVTVNVGVQEIYAAWRHKAVGIGFVLTVLCCSTTGSSILFRRALLRRLAAEQALRKAAERLELMATTDALTGLRNRRELEVALQREWQRGSRTQMPLSVLMLDADCFKLLNDHYGHQAGDEVLKAIARCIELAAFRSADMCARYGGEEFIVLLPETELEGALVVAERIRASIEYRAIPHAASPLGKVTVSVGAAAAYPDPGKSPEWLVHQADRALYQAKQAGRNRVLAAEGAGLEEASPPSG